MVVGVRRLFSIDACVVECEATLARRVMGCI